MNEVISDFMAMGVDLMVAAAMISSIVSVLMMSSTFIGAVSDQNTQAARLSYIRQYLPYMSQYNPANKTESLTTADFLYAAKYYNQGDSGIKVLLRMNGTTYIVKPNATNKERLDLYDGNTYKGYLTNAYCYQQLGYFNGYIVENNINTGSKTQVYNGGLVVGIYFEPATNAAGGPSITLTMNH